MILFKGCVYDLKYKEDRQALSTKVFQDMKYNTSINDYVNKFNKLNIVIMRGDENKLSKSTKYRNEYKLTFRYVHQESILENVLRNLGYNYDKSWSSRSIYAYNDEGERIRISNHKPSKRKFGNKEKSLTFGKGVIKGFELINNGFNKVNPEQEYYLY